DVDEERRLAASLVGSLGLAGELAFDLVDERLEPEIDLGDMTEAVDIPGFFPTGARHQVGIGRSRWTTASADEDRDDRVEPQLAQVGQLVACDERVFVFARRDDESDATQASLSGAMSADIGEIESIGIADHRSFDPS